MEEIKEIRLTVPWGYVATKHWGLSTNPPVLLVHGILDNASAFDRLIPYLPKNFYYVCIDLPGHGLSSHFPSGIPLDFWNYVLTIRYIIDELGWTNFIYIGHSLGAQIGSVYSIIYPGKVLKLLLIDGVIPIPMKNHEIVDRITTIHDSAVSAVKEPHSPLYTREEIIYSLQCRRMSYLTTEAAEALFDRAVTRVGDKYSYNRDVRVKVALRIILNQDQITSLLLRLGVKVTFIVTAATYGSGIALGLTKFLEAVQNFPNFHLAIVEGNHDVHNNNPEKVAPEILRFLNSDFASKL